MDKNKFTNIRDNKDGIHIGNCTECGAKGVMIINHECEANDFTEFFASKSGDKINIQIEITGDVNEVAKKLYKSFRDGTDIMEGAKVSKILFKGKDFEGEIEREFDDVLSNISNKLVETISNLRGELKSDDVDGVKN
jgi:hypothetical protein